MSTRAVRSRRHTVILRLLRDRSIASQAALAEALAGEGHRVTQSTLSRDLKDLRVLRVPTDNGYRYVPGEAAANGVRAGMRSAAAAHVREVTANESLVIVRTRIGHASGVASFLDRRRPEGVLATLAGDDTILVVPESVDETQALEEQLRELLAAG